MWQELRTELHPKGLEVVTVALDMGGEQAAGPWIDLAKPEHPALIDEGHLLDELLGVVNVPTGVWIDEQGTIVRPPEPAFPGKAVIAELPIPKEAPPRINEMMQEAAKMRIDPQRYVAALRDWADNGASSPLCAGTRRRRGALATAAARGLARGGVLRVGSAPAPYG